LIFYRLSRVDKLVYEQIFVRDINFFLFKITHLFAWPPGFGFDPKELLKAIPE